MMKKILIVDDEKFIRNGISAIINNNFPDVFQTELAKNGKEALEFMQKTTFDLIITDINMPFMNGIDFIKELRQSKQELTVIVISGYDEFEYARQCMKYGVQNYLLKPINDKELVEVIKENLKNSSSETIETVDDEKKLEYVYIEKAKDYIEKNYYKDINMAVVSNYVSLNYSYFSSIFNKDTGMNFSDYLNFVRIEKAKVLLKNIDYKIHEISEMVGYKNPKHFTKNFKKFTKLTPVEYRISKWGIIMIDFSMESKLYKFSKFIYEIMKINIMIFLLSLTIVGIGSSISSGFYEINQVFRKKADSNFGRFIRNFKVNFKKSLYFSAPIIFILYVFWRHYSFSILSSKIFTYGFLLLTILVISYMFGLLIATGLLDMTLKNTLIYGIMLVTEKVFLIIPVSILLVLFSKFVLLNFPVILIFFNIIIPVVFYYLMYEKIINNKKFLTEEGENLWKNTCH